MKSKTTLATLAALGAQIIYGFSFLSTKIALGYASPMTVIADRYIVAFIFLSIIMLITRTKVHLGKNAWKLLLMAFFQPVLYFLCETYGIDLTTSAFSSIMISLIPVMSMVCGIFMLNEVPSPMQYVFATLSVTGVVIMAISGNSDGTVTMLGAILLFGAVISSVGQNILSRQISSEFSPMERTYAMMVVGLVVFLGIALVENIKNPVAILEPFLNTSYTLSILYLGLLSSVLAFLLMNYANTHLPVAKTTVFANVTTVVSVLAGVIFLHEPFSVISAVATVMIIIGVWGVQRLQVKKK